MHLAASVRIVGPGPSGNRPLDPVLQRRAATSVVGLCGTPSTSIISGVGCAETRGSLQRSNKLLNLRSANRCFPTLCLKVYGFQTEAVFFDNTINTFIRCFSGSPARFLYRAPIAH